nr:unnamed protein product [Callosobruchus analis]
MVALVTQFIEAERTGNWELHLSTIERMLPFFHAAGHCNYASSARFYVQDMRQLDTKMNLREYRKFISNGYFTLRRSDKQWSAIWSDMTIEQTLMRSMKSTGGLTRGRDISDSVLSKWILGIPVMQQVTGAIEEFVDVISSNTEQHVDSRPTRQTRDNNDANKLMEWLSEHAPFSSYNGLVSLSTGIVGGDEINCHMVLEIRMTAMDKIVGKKIL